MAGRRIIHKAPSESFIPNAQERETETRTLQEVPRPFAGRLGGNQEFSLARTDPNYEKVLKDTPDAAPIFSWRESFDMNAFRNAELWQQSVFEGFATSLLVFITGLIAIGLVPAIPETSLCPLIPSIVGGITNAIVLPLFIFAIAPVSGGHLNPMITMTTFFCRLATFPRTVLYILFQTAGATVGGFMIRAGLGVKFGVIPGCYIDPSLVSPGQAFVLELMTALTLLILAVGVGLDPRQRSVYGPAFAPILVGASLGITTFGTGYVKAGYTGASLNPARCFGLLAATETWTYHYIHWVGPLIASMIIGAFYYTIPPYKMRREIP